MEPWEKVRGWWKRTVEIYESTPEWNANISGVMPLSKWSNQVGWYREFIAPMYGYFFVFYDLEILWKGMGG